MLFRASNFLIRFCLAGIFQLLLSFGSIAQSKKISGIITRDDNTPLFGATITINNSNKSTTTDSAGSFSMYVNEGDVLLASYIGFQSKELKITTETSFKLSLSASFMELDEVLLTGYSYQKVKEITGSVATVKPKELTAVPAGQVEQMLQGRVAGLTVITSGEPGSATNVRLHGIGNFGDVTPLYIIDGIEGDINSINPYDVESLQVLKDAGAFSIYGVRGANGVILVTTKKGKPGKTKVGYDFYVGYQQPLKEAYEMLSPQENADLLWIALKNAGQVVLDPLYGSGPTPVLPYYLVAGPHVGLPEGDARADPSLYNIDPSSGDIYQIVRFDKTGTDWFHETFKPAWSQNHTLTFSGGNDKNSYLFSMGYLDQQGTLINTYLKRYTARINTEFMVTDNIRVGENVQFSYSKNPKTGNNVGASYLTDPFLPVYDIKGNWSSLGAGAPGGGFSPGPADNPVGSRELSKHNVGNNWLILGNVYAEIDFLKKFSFKTWFGGNQNNYNAYEYFYGTYALPPNGFNSRFNENSGYSRSWSWTNTLSFAGNFGNHLIKALAGMEEKSNYNREVGGSRTGYFTNDPNYRFLSTGYTAGQTNYSFASTSFLSSFFGQVEYGFQEKYFFKSTIRRDGSSIFGPENRYGWFPSFSVAWRMTEEDFWKKSKWLTDLKLRASWGKTGFYGNTNPSNQYTLYGGASGSAYYDINGISFGNIQQGFRPVRIGNPRTGWQEDIVTNIGFESVFWNGKINITADWYNKKSTGLLFPVALPAVLGDATPPNVNVGDVKNSGVDILVGSKGKFSKNWSWDALITFSHYENKIVKLNALQYFDDYYTRYGPFVRNEIGYPVGSFFGYKIVGIFQSTEDVSKSPQQDAAAPGRFKYADVNGRDSNGKLTGKPDGQITGDDRTHYGNPNPKFTLGFNAGINYGNFDFSTFFYGSFGNDVWNDWKYTFDVFPSQLFLTPKSKTALYHSWTPDRPNATAPIVENDQNFSNSSVVNSYSLEKGSYLRNKSMILGYTFSKNSLQKFRIEKFRVYVQIVNLFTITDYTGTDPELSGTSTAFGIDYVGNYPNNQVQYIIGLNLNF